MKENLNVLIFKLDKHIAMLEFSREQIFFISLFFSDFSRFCLPDSLNLIVLLRSHHIYSITSSKKLSWESSDHLGWKRR